MRRAWVEVDLGALKRNATTMARLSGVPLLPMVKSDAYGLGVGPVVKALESVGPWGFGVGTVAEGAQLRELGVEKPILVFVQILADEFREARDLRLTPTFGDPGLIDEWHAAGGGPWHLAVDTGMSRAGVSWNGIADVESAIRACPPEGVFTHFHSAEQHDGSVELQERRFDMAIAALPARPRFVHAENSPSIERRGASRWSLARPGVFLYGVGGDDEGTLVRPDPVASLHARIVDVREIDPGETVSYGATWTASRPSRIATVAAGYADGVRRHLSNRGAALVSGRRVPIAGVVTMDMTMLDVTDVDCRIGDVATFLGSQGESTLTIDEVARSGDLSPYELLVGLRLRAPRRYVES
jgi:alanine racemase